MGDVSPKNLLFSLTPHEAVYFIDCDAMRINEVSALPQVETPGWDTPAGEDLATIYSDTYKLGLLALRLVAGDHDTTNRHHIPPTTPDLLRQIITDTLTNPPQQRPLPEAWTYVLGHAIEHAQHQKITPTPPVSTAPPPPSIPIVHSRPPAHSAPPSSRPLTPPPPSPQWARPPQWAPPDSESPQSQTKLWAVVAVAAIVVVVAVVAISVGLAAHNNGAPSSAPAASSAAPTSTTSATTTPAGPPPVPEAALQGLLLSPDQADSAMGATDMVVTGPPSPDRPFDYSEHVADKACLPLHNVADIGSLANSGWSAVRSQNLDSPDQAVIHGVDQAVVSFPSADQAAAFFAVSTQRWPACADRQYHYTVAGKPDAVWTVGPVSTINGVLSVAETVGGGDSSWTWNWMSCQRALTVANNVAIDIKSCSKNRSDSPMAVDIARQIAAKVPTT